MSQYKVKDGDGALFRNEHKETERHADYRGQIFIDGKEYWLSAWIKTSKAGAKYMSLSAQPKDGGPKQKTRMDSRQEFDDSIPF